eukprot:CAMPEP_0204584976 /NCGR_PEP_ID=MMETSP0661-20131031/46651_1 /ASSEMBLY_ACC=CAM_ASM_000606 /TAXON_ID=109239 /ORGANISM="Alexandrium margalefi, Strain AMGDE01CS-322" /LENGTH=127 /DNA_ID=CAMNT_0051594481 /DNA_START=24 /DNA_END=405 /DNA_ORIENTATION=-
MAVYPLVWLPSREASGFPVSFSVDTRSPPQLLSVRPEELSLPGGGGVPQERHAPTDLFEAGTYSRASRELRRLLIVCDRGAFAREAAMRRRQHRGHRDCGGRLTDGHQPRHTDQKSTGRSHDARVSI